MAETYGPSNWGERPQEGRSRIKKEPTPGQRDGEMEVVIWQARDLMEEQVSFALDRKELSPNSMLGLAWKLSSEVINSQETSVWKKTILDHEALILHACEEYIKIPPAVIEQSVHAGDRVKKTAREPQKLAHIVIDYIDTLKGTSISPTDREIKDHYAVGCLSDILNITAIFLDQQRKKKSD
jgi:hypothetical protein